MLGGEASPPPGEARNPPGDFLPEGVALFGTFKLVNLVVVLPPSLPRPAFPPALASLDEGLSFGTRLKPSGKE